MQRIDSTHANAFAEWVRIGLDLTEVDLTIGLID
jgi:hypothetical protein